jgi:hypothetical protein
VNRWAAAFPILGALAALLVLAPNSLADVPRALTSLTIAVTVGLVSFGYVWLRSRSARRRARALDAVATVGSDPDSLELAAHIAGVPAPRLGTFALVGTTAGIQLWSSETHMDVELPWSAIRSVDVDPGVNPGVDPGTAPGTAPGSRSRPGILVYTEVSPRIALRFDPRSRFGVLRPRLDAVGAIVARLRELQPRPSA